MDIAGPGQCHPQFNPVSGNGEDGIRTRETVFAAYPNVNRTPSATQQQAIIHLLVEGNSIRSIERLTGVHGDNIMRLAVKVGDKCKTFLNAWMRNLNLRHIQADEIWTYVGCKQHNLSRAMVVNSMLGDQFLYVAFDQDIKLIATYAIGKRSKEVTQAFMYDLADRIITDAPQLSTDGWQAYPNAVKNAFGDEIAYGQIIKEFAESPQLGRYGPPVMVASERRQITGLTEIDKFTICTSHVERNNLTIRHFIKRFARLTLAFSKKLENLAAAVALHVVYYNFCRVHGAHTDYPGDGRWCYRSRLGIGRIAGGDLNMSLTQKNTTAWILV